MSKVKLQNIKDAIDTLASMRVALAEQAETDNLYDAVDIVGIQYDLLLVIRVLEGRYE